MGYSAILTAVCGVLEGVSGIGVVHSYERHAVDWDKFLTLFKSGSKINGWIVTRRSVPTQLDWIPAERRSHQFLIRGYYGISDSDASELDFQDLVEAIQDAFKTQDTLGGVAIDCDRLQVDVIEPRVFGSVLCHVAEMTLVVHECVLL